MPPSVNTAFYTDRQTQTRHKSSEYRSYERECSSWALRNAHALGRARDLTLKTGPGAFLSVDHTFYFLAGDILMLADSRTVRPGERRKRRGDPKKNDTSNRIKILDDCLGRLLGIDDCFFWDGSYRKRIARPEFGPYVDTALTLVTPFIEDK